MISTEKERERESARAIFFPQPPTADRHLGNARVGSDIHGHRARSPEQNVPHFAGRSISRGATRPWGQLAGLEKHDEDQSSSVLVN